MPGTSLATYRLTAETRPPRLSSRGGRFYSMVQSRTADIIRDMPSNLRQAVPVLRVANFEAAQSFYCAKLGFQQEWVYQPNQTINPSYAGLSRDGVQFHVSSFPGDGVFGSVVNFYVADVDALFSEFAARGVAVDLTPTDQTWGTREMYVRDADGNCLRFSQPASLEQEPR